MRPNLECVSRNFYFRVFLQDGKCFTIGVQGKAAKGSVRICDIAYSLKNCIACLLLMFRLIFLLKRFFSKWSGIWWSVRDDFSNPNKLVEWKINETRRSMPVNSARYKVTVWLCPPGNLLKQTHSPEKKGSFLVFNGKNQPTRLQFKDMEKCWIHQLEDYPIFRDDQNHDSN